jgi:hypothetical protein
LVFLSHFGPCRVAPLMAASWLYANLRTPNHCTRVLAHIALVNPEPTLFFFELFVLFTMEPYSFEAAKHDKLGTYGGRVAYPVKATPIFIGCTSPHHHSLASLLSVSGSLTKFSKNYYFYTLILYYCQ